MLPNTTLDRHADRRGDGNNRLLIEQLEHLVHVRTAGRVSDLKIQLQGQEVILSGKAATFHIKQLATQAVLEVLSSETLTNAIQVSH